MRNHKVWIAVYHPVFKAATIVLTALHGRLGDSRTHEVETPSSGAGCMQSASPTRGQ